MLDEDTLQTLNLVTDYLAAISDYLGKQEEDNREFKIAREKLEEAVFWIEYGKENLDDE